MFSALYLALVLVLVALFGRGVSFEWRGSAANPRWLAGWSWALTIGSILIPLLLGVALGDLLHGLPINGQHNFTGTFFSLLTGYGLMTGVTLLVLCLLHGATFLALRTTGEILRGPQSGAVDRPRRGARQPRVVHLDAGRDRRRHGAAADPDLRRDRRDLAWRLATTDNDGWAFIASGFAIAAAIGQIFIALYPNVMVSSTNHAYNLTVNNSAAGHYGLVVMTVVAVLFFPVILLYQGWSFHVFRRRVAAPAAPEQESAAPGPAAPQTYRG